MRKNRIPALAALVLVAALAAGCATTGPRPMPGGRGQTATLKMQLGVASYYGVKFHGRMTSSGERYNMGELTAAHRTLPFGTRVRVTNLINGKQVVLRINDRGPFKKARIIDVSRRAARELGFEQLGTTRVRIEVVG